MGSGGRETSFEDRSSSFDALVDRTVRQMLSVEPRADLRARVIETTSPRASLTIVASAFRRKMLFAAPLAAAILLLAFWWPLRSVRVASVPVPQVARVIDAPTVHPPVLPHPLTREFTRDATRPQRPVAHTTLPVAARVRTSDMPPLNQIAPIHIESVATASIAPKEITVEPLAPIAEVQIAPLNPPDRRN